MCLNDVGIFALNDTRQDSDDLMSAPSHVGSEELDEFEDDPFPLNQWNKPRTSTKSITLEDSAMSSFVSSASDSWNDEKGIEVTFEEKAQRRSSLGPPSRRRPSHAESESSLHSGHSAPARAEPSVAPIFGAEGGSLRKSKTGINKKERLMTTSLGIAPFDSSFIIVLLLRVVW